MSTQEPNVPYGTTGERVRALALNAESRERLAALWARYWEVAAYAVLALVAGGMRFWNLGARAYHHDESLHGFFSYGFTQGLRWVFTFHHAGADETYRHVPFMHGPFQFIGNGFMMFIFGDGDYQGRMLAATMGTGLVLLPWLLRKQLGTAGALATAAFIAFSPTLLYYSRFTREDIYTAFWTFGIVIFMWRYLTSGQDRFLYLTTGFMAGAFCTKETTFMTIGAFLIFLEYMLAVRFANTLRERQPMDDLRFAGTVLVLFFVAWAVALLWPFIADQRRKRGWEEMPREANLAIVMATLAAPMYAAMVQFAPGFGSTWKDRAGDVGNLHVASGEKGVAYASVFLLIGLSALIGLSWKPKQWLIAAACFWVPVVLLATTFFTNIDGFMSVVWGSADYWISQQKVARGNQPIYYYFMTIPVYEFLPLIIATIGAVYFVVRGRLDQALLLAGGFVAIIVFLLIRPGPELSRASLFHVWVPFSIVLLGVFTLRMDMFTRFLIFWAVITSFSLTVASEKMPWLNVHIALPLAVIAGRFIGDLLGRTDLREDLPPLERFAPFAYAALAAALAVLVFVVVGPFTLASAGAWILVVVAAAGCWWAYTSYSKFTAAQVALVGLVAALGIFTIRAGVLSSLDQGGVNPALADYSPGLSTNDHGALPVELLVYTQTSGDIPILRDMIDRYAKETGLGKNTPIVVDSSDGLTWPWAWYLREYKSVAYTGISQGYQPQDPRAVLLISKQNVPNLNLAGQYDDGIAYHHRRWFPEEYRGKNGVYTTHDFFGDLFSKSALSNWLDYWVRRTPPAQIGTLDGVAFFPKGFSHVETQPVGPTVRTEGTQLVIGGTGTAPGQLSQPSNVRTDAQGNIYVADTNNNRIEKYDPQGNYLAAAGGFAAGTNVPLVQPWSMVVAPDGTVFVADTWDHKIVKLDKDLNKVKEWGSGAQTEAGGDPLKLFGPRDIVLTADSNILITDTGNGRMIAYTQDGDPVGQWGQKAPDNAPNPGPLDLAEPVGLAVAPNGDVYLADYWNKRIVHYDKDFNARGQIAVPSWGSHNVTDRPYLALLPDGRLLATDPANAKVLVFAADGSPLPSYDVPQVNGQPARPVGVWVDGDSVLVSDGASNVVRKIPVAEVVK
ncbi:MAG TPA: flippase activity-associated protein Agl23 [Dehalococcoidia bacterium]|nr:flippase activity-associated protein Agl23 [Dehalococcoidia bacterium]